MSADATWSGERILVRTGAAAYRLFVRDTGPRSASAVVFLHGFPTSSLDWRKIAPRFEDRRAIFVDLLGFGHSEKPRIRYAYGLHADLVVALLRTLDVTSASIVAHDYSVTLAQELLRRERDAALPAGFALDRIVLLNGGVYGRLHRKQRFHRLLLTPLLAGLVARRVRPAALARGLNAIAGTTHAWSTDDAREHWQSMAAGDGLARLPRLVHYIADRRRHGAVWESAMEAAADRIGFVWGPADPVSGAHVLSEIRRRMPSSPTVALEGVGHYPHWEAPDATADAVLELLGGGAR